VVDRAVGALVETYELLVGEGLAEGAVRVEAQFDEFSLDVFVRYHGNLPERPAPGATAQQMIHGQTSVAALAGVLLYRLADRVRMKASGPSCELELHFEH
jgi:NCS2 family nucleobase:cation symporter-2